MRPVEEAVREAGIAALIGMGCAVHKISGGKAPKHLFLRNVPHEHIGSRLKVLKQTEDSSFIAKVDENGKITDEDFTVVLATDLHIDKDDALTDKTISMLVRHLEDVKPDLLILTGDIIVSDYQQLDCVQFAKMMEEIGIYWAFVFGNHEARAEKEFHKFFMLKNLSKYEHCLSKFGPKELFGYGNFFINIMNSDSSIRQSFAFFDSGRDITDKYRKEYGLSDDVKGYDFIKNNQIEWFLNHIKALKSEYGDFKSMVFMHIPIPEYAEVIDIDENEKPVPIGRPNGKGEILFGEMHETVGCSVYNSGLFDKAREIGTQAFFSGHDHVNDYCAVYKGVYLVYVQMGGYEIYHLDKFGLLEKQWIQGVTTLDIHNDGSFKLGKRFNRMYL